MLGVLSGVLAALVYLPTVIPATWQIVNAQEAMALRHSRATAAVISALMRQGVILTDGALTTYGVDLIVVSTRDGRRIHRLGADIDAASLAEVCALPRREDLRSVQGALWATACLQDDAFNVIVAHRPDFTTYQRILYVVFLLAVAVGIITALGILRLLSPISQVSRALARVGAGERGVRMSNTGLAELDELADRLNAAAQAMETREDTILARIQLVQEMARLVAHEIRNPLQSLELLTTLVVGEESPSERKELGDAIHDEIRALNKVVLRMLSQGVSGGALRLERVMQPVAPMLEQVVTLRRPEANARGVRLYLGGLSQAQAPVDRALLGRSIENLVLNALQAVADEIGEVRISLHEDGHRLCVVVEDNGLGVDPALADAIFEPNVTSKRHGSGLGLALVRGVIEAHGGTIGYGRSTLGGARFEARLPTSPAPGPDLAGQGAPTPP